MGSFWGGIKVPPSKTLLNTNNYLSLEIKKHIIPIWPAFCSFNPYVLAFNHILPLHPIHEKGGDIMKKIAIELIIVAATVMAYAVQVFAWGGGG